MSELPAGYHSLQVRAYDFQGREGPAYTAILRVVPKPIWLDKPWVLDPLATWQGERGYLFTGIVPNNPRLHYEKNITLPYLGTLKNIFESDIHITETLKLDGDWKAEATGILNVTILNKRLVYEEYRVRPFKDIRVTRHVKYYDFTAGPYTLYKFRTEVYSGTVYTILGLATVKLSVDFGFNAKLTATGKIRNNLSVEEMRFIPSIEPYLAASVWAIVDFLLGTAKAGATVTPAFSYSLPVVYANPPPPGKDTILGCESRTGGGTSHPEYYLRHLQIPGP
jgi:hypothetical protein